MNDFVAEKNLNDEYVAFRLSDIFQVSPIGSEQCKIVFKSGCPLQEQYLAMASVSFYSKYLKGGIK